MAAKILVTLFLVALCAITIYLIMWLDNPHLFSKPIFRQDVPEGYTLMRPDGFNRMPIVGMLFTSCVLYVLGAASCWIEYLPFYRGDHTQIFVPMLIATIVGIAISLLSSIYFYLVVANKLLYNSKEIKQYLPFHKKSIVLSWNEILSAEFHYRERLVILKSAKQQISVSVFFSGFSDFSKLVKTKIPNYSEI